MQAVRCDVTTPSELGVGERERWEELRAAVPALESPFLSSTFTAHVGAVRRDTRVAVLRGDESSRGDIMGFLPFHVGPTRLGRPIGRGLSNAQGAVASPTFDWDAGAVVRRAGLRALTFDVLVENQPAITPYVKASDLSPQIDLTGGFEAYLEAARGSGRGGPREAAKRQRQFARSFELRYTWDEREPAALRTLLAWKSEQFRRTGAFDWASRPWVVDLFERLHASDAPDCAGVLSTLHAGNSLVAVQFSLRSGGHLAGWMTAYASDWAMYSPGSVLHLALLKEAPGHGVRVFDLGQGTEAYKLRWAVGGSRVSRAVVTGGAAGARVSAVSRMGWGLAKRTALREHASRLQWRLDVG